MILLLLLIPAVAGGLAFLLRNDRLRRVLLLAVAIAHTLLTALCWAVRPPALFGGWLELDPAALLVLSTTSVLFLAAALYAVGYLAREGRTRRSDVQEGFLFTNAPEAIFTGCLLLFLSTMTLVAAAQHFGLMWVAVEATTLASAPLIHFHRHHRSLEAAWKYLLICSVGIAIALLGNFFLVVAAGPRAGALTVEGLVRGAARLDPVWLKAAFVLLLVGYGTKMGLAPLHTWLPDAHSEAPSVVSALLSGALLNCAFLAILRVHAVCTAAGQGEFARSLLVLFGLVSMGLAAVFIIRQGDYKRMLAYSSVEHMGVSALGIGIGGVAGFGALLHAMNHSLAKAMLFLLSGNILAAYRSKSVGAVGGLLRVLPVTGALWLAGFFAITGTPPFGMFVSELTILKGALDGKHIWVAVLYLALLLVIFAGMAAVFLRMAFGERGETLAAGPGSAAFSLSGAAADGGTFDAGARRESPLALIPPAALCLGALLLGVWLPPPFGRAIAEALRSLGLQ